MFFHIGYLIFYVKSIFVATLVKHLVYLFDLFGCMSNIYGFCLILCVCIIFSGLCIICRGFVQSFGVSPPQSTPPPRPSAGEPPPGPTAAAAVAPQPPGPLGGRPPPGGDVHRES